MVSSWVTALYCDFCPKMFSKKGNRNIRPNDQRQHQDTLQDTPINQQLKEQEELGHRHSSQDVPTHKLPVQSTGFVQDGIRINQLISKRKIGNPKEEDARHDKDWGDKHECHAHQIHKNQ